VQRADVALIRMSDAEKDWHKRAFRQKLTRSVIFPAFVFFSYNYYLFLRMFLPVTAK
jgi:hypothetical protein